MELWKASQEISITFVLSVFSSSEAWRDYLGSESCRLENFSSEDRWKGISGHASVENLGNMACLHGQPV